MRHRSGPLASAVLAIALFLVGALAWTAPRGPASASTASPAEGPAAQGTGITVEWLGWSHYRLTSPAGTVVVTNPRITNSPDAPISLEEAMGLRTDIIVVAD